MSIPCPAFGGGQFGEPGPFGEGACEPTSGGGAEPLAECDPVCESPAAYGQIYGPEAQYGQGDCDSVVFESVAEGSSAGPYDNRGGYEVTFSGLFPLGKAVEVFFGRTASPSDTPCYGGLGYGYLPESADGLTLTVIVPPVDGVGDDFYFSARYAEDEQCPFGPVTVIERTWKEKERGVHRGFPRWMALSDDEVA